MQLAEDINEQQKETVNTFKTTKLDKEHTKQESKFNEPLLI